MGLAGLDFFGAVERWIGRSLPDDFHDARAAEDARAIEEGIGGGRGRGRLRPRPAAGFAQGDLLVQLQLLGAKAICAISASTALFAGQDLLGQASMSRAASRRRISICMPRTALRVPIDRMLIIEDLPVGVQGALASGATVLGLVAGSHCGPDHESACASSA